MASTFPVEAANRHYRGRKHDAEIRLPKSALPLWARKGQVQRGQTKSSKLRQRIDRDFVWKSEARTGHGDSFFVFYP
jgi:hypothetical protein